MAAADHLSVGFLTWSSTVPTGGNVYDDRLDASLQAAGFRLQRHRVSGTWPTEADLNRTEVSAALREPRVWLVDSIIACAVPDLITEATTRGQPLAVLLHSLLSTEIGMSDIERQRYRVLEAAALRAAGRVITTSHWAADDLSRRYGLTQTVVAHPGVDTVPLTDGSTSGQRLLCLGSLTPTKNQLGFVRSLGLISHLPWSARLVGGDLVRPDYTSAVRQAVSDHRLDDRIEVTGPMTGSALEQVWATTDLLVLTSRSETYAMVVVEALAHGIPAVVSSETGAVEALGEVDNQVPGAAVPAADPDALAAVLEHWLIDPQLRHRWRTAARRRRETLESWADCAAAVLAVLTDLSSRDR